MRSVITALLALFAFAATQASAFTISTEAGLQKRAKYPFDHLVAFGDELSDNGNGSCAHGISGDPLDVYGFGTWTDGPVAVSYLANLLDVPLRDYAFGGCCGGSKSGATIDNAYTPAEAHWHGKPVPSVHDQIYSNYTKSTPADIKESLQFIWVGQNDLDKQTDAFWAADPKNAAFPPQMAKRTTAAAEYLVEKGAPYVFVVNIYPKHLAPLTKTYLCPDGSCVALWGKIIHSANEAMRESLSRSKYSKHFIYYDVFGFMIDLMHNKDKYGLTEPLKFYCDGVPSSPDDHWDECFTESSSRTIEWQGAAPFFWMNFIEPTTRVHRLIALNMKARIDEFLGA